MEGIPQRFQLQTSWLTSYTKLNPDKSNVVGHPLLALWDCYSGKTDTGGEIFFVCVPSKDFQFCYLGFDQFVEIAEGSGHTLPDHIWVVVDGVVSEELLEGFLHRSNHSHHLIPWFLDVETSVDYDHLIMTKMDGVDWARSLISKQLIFEWD